MAVGIGILGAANIANKNARAIGLADNAEVVAVGSRDRSKAEALIERWGIQGAAAYGSYEEVLADPRVQAVYIPLPSALHAPWVKKAAAAGKHILLEKPVAINSGELEEVLAACRGANVQLMDGTMWMHNPRAHRMASFLQNFEAVGQVKEVMSSFSFAASAEFLQKDVRIRKDCDPLGALGDLGWYCVRAILWAYGYETPTSVTAHSGAEYTKDGIPLHMGATLVFSGGRRGHFQCGFDLALTQTLEVIGTKGAISLNDFVIPREELKSSFSVSSKHGLEFWDTYDGTLRDTVSVNLTKPQEVLMWETFCRLVERVQAGGQPDPFWPRISELTQRVLLAVEQSAGEGCREVPLSP